MQWANLFQVSRREIVWDLDPLHQVDQACLLAGRNLTRTEWTNYLGALGEWRATCPEFE